jgi:hypothetical protein
MISFVYYFSNQFFCTNLFTINIPHRKNYDNEEFMQNDRLYFVAFTNNRCIESEQCFSGEIVATAHDTAAQGYGVQECDATKVLFLFCSRVHKKKIT